MLGGRAAAIGSGAGRRGSPDWALLAHRRKHYGDLRSWPSRDSKPFSAALRRGLDAIVDPGIPTGWQRHACSPSCRALRWPAC